MNLVRMSRKSTVETISKQSKYVTKGYVETLQVISTIMLFKNSYGTKKLKGTKK